MITEHVDDFMFRPMKCELNYLSKSDGSAILSQGETVVLVSMNGPLDIKSTSQNIEKATVEVLFSSKGGKPSVADRFKEHVIKQTCETAIMSCLYPRTGITLTIQELEDYGGVMIEFFGKLFLALTVGKQAYSPPDGVSMRHMVAAVSCAVDEVGNLVLEPTLTQIQNARALFYFVFDSREKNLVTSLTEGNFSEDTFEEALVRCRLASSLVFDMFREVIKKHCNVIWRRDICSGNA